MIPIHFRAASSNLIGFSFQNHRVFWRNSTSTGPLFILNPQKVPKSSTVICTFSLKLMDFKPLHPRNCRKWNPFLHLALNAGTYAIEP